MRCLLLIPLFVALVAGCSDRSDDPGLDQPDIGHDAAEHDDHVLELGSSDFEASEPATLDRIEIAPVSRRGVISAEPPLDVTALLSPRNQYLHALLGDDVLLTNPLPGQAASSSYNALRFFPEADGPTRFGVGIQIWEFSDNDARDERRTALHDQFLNTSPAPEDFSDAFLSRRAGITTLVLNGPDLLLLAISCDEEACDHPSALLPLAESLRTP